MVRHSHPAHPSNHPLTANSHGLTCPSHPPLTANSQDPTGPTPLEDISDALFAAYQDSSWCYRQDKAAAGPTGGEGIPLPLYSAALRVTLMPWDEPPQMVAASFAERLGRVRTFAEALGVPDSVHQEVRPPPRPQGEDDPMLPACRLHGPSI